MAVTEAKPRPLYLTGTYVTSLGPRLDSRLVSSAENRWSGRNKSGYTNPRVDALLDRLSAAVDPRDHLVLRRELVREVMGDIALMPLYWELRSVLSAKGVRRNIHPNNPGWNGFEWDKG